MKGIQYIGSESGVCEGVIRRCECSAAGMVNDADDMQLGVSRNVTPTLPYTLLL